jgi:hypothetical protein
LRFTSSDYAILLKGMFKRNKYGVFCPISFRWISSQGTLYLSLEPTGLELAGF